MISKFLPEIARSVMRYCRELAPLDLGDFDKLLPSLRTSIDDLEVELQKYDKSFWPCVKPLMDSLFQEPSVLWSALFVSIRDRWIPEKLELQQGVTSSSLIVSRQEVGSSWQKQNVADIIPTLYRSGLAGFDTFATVNVARALTRSGHKLQSQRMVLDNSTKGMEGSYRKVFSDAHYVNIAGFLNHSGDLLQATARIASILQPMMKDIHFRDLKLQEGLAQEFSKLDKLLEKNIIDLDPEEVFPEEAIRQIFVENKSLLPFARYLAFVSAMSPNFSRIVIIVPPSGAASIPPVGGIIVAEEGVPNDRSLARWSDLAAALPTILWLWQVQANLHSEPHLQEHQLIQDAIVAARHETDNAKTCVDAPKTQLKMWAQRNGDNGELEGLLKRLDAAIAMVVRPIKRLEAVVKKESKHKQIPKRLLSETIIPFLDAFPYLDWKLRFGDSKAEPIEFSWESLNKEFAKWTNFRICQESFETVIFELLYNAKNHSYQDIPTIILAFSVGDSECRLEIVNFCDEKPIFDNDRLGVRVMRRLCSTEGWRLTFAIEESDNEKYRVRACLSIRRPINA